jgi:hypothetical protein
MNMKAGRREGMVGIVTETAQSVPQHGDVEIYQKCDRDPGEPQVGQCLGLVDRKKAFDGLDLDEKPFSNDDVEAVSAFERESLVNQRYLSLSLERYPSQRQLVTETALIG